MAHCPECGSKISSVAKSCPYCGYSSRDNKSPISNELRKADTHIVIPEASVFDGGINLISSSSNEALVRFFSDAEQVERLFPSVFQAIQNIMSRGETKYVADFSKTAEDLMRKGELVLGVGKDGSILPQLRNAKTQRVYETARLKANQIPKDILPSLIDVQLQMTMAQVLAEIRDLAASIEALQMENHADRMAQAEGAWLRLQQAAKIRDARLREAQLLNAANSATDARCILQKNLSLRMRLLDKGSTTSKSGNANNALQDLTAITLMARTEYAAFSLLDESEAARECLQQLSSFLAEENLNNRDVLLEINSQAKLKHPEIVEGFHAIAQDVLLALNGTVDYPAYLPSNNEETNHEES